MKSPPLAPGSRPQVGGRNAGDLAIRSTERLAEIGRISPRDLRAVGKLSRPLSLPSSGDAVALGLCTLRYLAGVPKRPLRDTGGCETAVVGCLLAPTGAVRRRKTAGVQPCQ